MNRTWEQNRESIHDFWPTHEFTPAEADLWREDLAELDQDLLFDCLKRVKRNRDTAWVHLRWVTDEYRAARRATAPPNPNVDMSTRRHGTDICPEKSQRFYEDFRALIEISGPDDFRRIQTQILDKLPVMSSLHALRALIYARHRLLGQAPQFGTVDLTGSVRPMWADPRDEPNGPQNAREEPTEAIADTGADDW